MSDQQKSTKLQTYNKDPFLQEFLAMKKQVDDREKAKRANFNSRRLSVKRTLAPQKPSNNYLNSQFNKIFGCE